jgi:hypothetical protein
MEKLRGLAEVQPRFDSVIGGFEDGNAVMRAQRGDGAMVMSQTATSPFPQQVNRRTRLATNRVQASGLPRKSAIVDLKFRGHD